MTDTAAAPHRRLGVLPAALTWLWVTVPFGYGVWQLVAKIAQLFGR
ncbi:MULTISPECIES: hypothetical protein [unclassified Mycobacterium]|nr:MULTISPECIES: hypothetical protein [unclassified Mycobacterium]